MDKGKGKKTQTPFFIYLECTTDLNVGVQISINITQLIPSHFRQAGHVICDKLQPARCLDKHQFSRHYSED